jgi:hypothetical protein
MPKEFDIIIDCGGKASQIKNAGYDFVGRYLSSHHWKVITPAEADELTTAGLAIVLVYEDNPTSPTYFSFGQGESDATRAAQQTSSLGAPDNTTIYFAVDYDASEHDLAGPIAECFQGVATGLRNFAAGNNPQYRIGVYGSGATCLAVIGTGLTSQGWLAQARPLARSRQIHRFFHQSELAEPRPWPIGRRRCRDWRFRRDAGCPVGDARRPALAP